MKIPFGKPIIENKEIQKKILKYKNSMKEKVIQSGREIKNNNLE